jgi:adenylylsulfate kinase
MKKGFTVWLTGYSGAGKTTISGMLYKRLLERRIASEILDGDIIRQNLSKGLSFSKEDRCVNILRIGFVAELLSRHGVGVIVSAISPYRSARDSVRSTISRFVEVHVKCSIGECERRDPKGLYRLVKSGEIRNFTGIDDPYEDPVDPEIVCNTEAETVEQSVCHILTWLQKAEFI